MSSKEKKIAGQLSFLLCELGNQYTSIERVEEIKGLSFEFARQIDALHEVSFLEGMLVDFYKKPTKYLRRRVKAAINKLLESVGQEQEEKKVVKRKKKVEGKDYVDMSQLRKG